MASPAAVSAVIRAYRPEFRLPADKLAFAIHAICSVNGLRLLAVGVAVDSADDAAKRSPDEASIDGWNATAAEDQGGYYSFLYAQPTADAGTPSGAGSAASGPPVLTVKSVVAGDQLLVSFLADPPSAGGPDTLELSVQRYSGDGVAPYAYSHLDELITRVQAAVNTQGTGGDASKATGASAPGRSAVPGVAQPQGSRGGQAPADRDPLRDYSQPSRGPPEGYPGRNPLAVGGEDFMPGMLPGLGGQMGPGLGGFGPGGGMHMGPGHPAFGGPGVPGRGGLPRPGFGGQPPGPGMRWDPIAPPGLPGYNPNDFARPQRPRMPGMPPDIDPDVMQPGPGRGTDFDEMYG